MATSGTAKVTLPEDTQILITREFDAPPNLIYQAWTTPELVSQWWTAKRGDIKVVEIDLRVGGKWRYAMDVPRPEGSFEVAFHGEYLEIVPNERLVSTEIYEGFPDQQAVNTLTLTELEGGRTLLKVLVQHTTKQHRDGHVESGMEDGLQDALDLLEGVAEANALSAQ